MTYKLKKVPLPDPSAFNVDIPAVVDRIIGLQNEFHKKPPNYRLTVYDDTGSVSKILYSEDRSLVSLHTEGLDPEQYLIELI